MTVLRSVIQRNRFILKDSVALSVTYMAEQPGRFDKIIKSVL